MTDAAIAAGASETVAGSRGRRYRSGLACGRSADLCSTTTPNACRPCQHLIASNDGMYACADVLGSLAIFTHDSEDASKGRTALRGRKARTTSPPPHTQSPHLPTSNCAPASTSMTSVA